MVYYAHGPKGQKMFSDNFLDFMLLLLNIWMAKSIYDNFLKDKAKKNAEAADSRKTSTKNVPPAAVEMIMLAAQHGWKYERGDLFCLYETKPAEVKKQELREYFINGKTRGPDIAQHIAEDFKAGTLVPIAVIRNKSDAANRQEILFGVDFKELEIKYKNFFDYLPDYRKRNSASN